MKGLLSNSLHSFCADKRKLLGFYRRLYFSMKRIHGKMSGEANYLIVTEIDIKMRAVISLRSSLRVIGLTTRI